MRRDGDFVTVAAPPNVINLERATSRNLAVMCGRHRPTKLDGMCYAWSRSLWLGLKGSKGGLEGSRERYHN